MMVDYAAKDAANPPYTTSNNVLFATPESMAACFTAPETRSFKRESVGLGNK